MTTKRFSLSRFVAVAFLGSVVFIGTYQALAQTQSNGRVVADSGDLKSEWISFKELEKKLDTKLKNCGYVDSNLQASDDAAPKIYALAKCGDVKEAKSEVKNFSCEGIVSCLDANGATDMYFHVRCLAKEKSQCDNAQACAEGSYFDAVQLSDTGADPQTQEYFQSGKGKTVDQ